jgi:hypothetical protein
MTELDFESAQLELLTEALRAGPGSPQWREAVASLDHMPGIATAEEYRLLCAARERLASGKGYREVRAGSGFTRGVLDAIEREEAAGGTLPKALPSANLIAALSAAAILGILAVVAFLIIPRGEVAGDSGGSELAPTYFTNTRAASRFESDLGVEWKAFGPLAVQAQAGLRPTWKQLDSATFRGGGVTCEQTFATDQPFALAATVRIPRPSDDVMVQLFVADDPAFAPPSATSAHEVVWSLRGSDASLVLPDGAVAAQAARVRSGDTPVELRLSVNGPAMQADVNGRRVWKGASQLDPARPRTAGIRFLARGTVAAKDAPVVESARVLVPQKP